MPFHRYLDFDVLYFCAVKSVFCHLLLEVGGYLYLAQNKNHEKSSDNVILDLGQMSTSIVESHCAEDITDNIIRAD